MTNNILLYIQREKESKLKYLDLDTVNCYGNILKPIRYLLACFLHQVYIVNMYTLYVYQEHKLYVEVAAALCEERIVWRDDGVPLIQNKENPNQYT